MLLDNMISSWKALSLSFLWYLLTVGRLDPVVGFNLDTKVRVNGQAVTNVPIISPTTDTTNEYTGTLTEYMTLPVEQYALVPMPLNSTLSRLPGGTTSEFELKVPPINFLGLEVQPVVEAEVALEPNRVIISSQKCRLNGSPFLLRVKMNERFDFRAKAELTWNDTASISHDHSVVGSAPTENSISAQASIEVDVDRPMPFNAIPKRAVEKMGNTAMRLSMGFVLRSFLRGLSTDYQRWANDPNYRANRSLLTKEARNISNTDSEE